MRTGITVLASWSVLFLTAAAHAQHGGGHVASAPQAPHFSAPHFSQPMMPYFEQPMMPRYNQTRTPHVNQSATSHVNQASGVRSNMGRAAGSDLSSAQHNNAVPVGRYVNRTTSKVHALSNALQENHAITGHHSGSSPNSKLAAALAKNSAGSGANKQAGTAGVTASAATPAAGQNTVASIANPPTSTSSQASPTKTATNLTTMSTGSSATPVTSTTTPTTTPTAGGSQAPTATKPTTVATTTSPTTGTTTTTTTPSLGSITPTTSTLTTSGNPTTFNSSTPSTFNPFGSTAPILNLGLGFGFGGNFGLMTLPNGHHYYVYYPSVYGGYGYGNRYYGNGYNNNSNNSMYFAQMRRLSRLVSDLNNLTQGGNVAPAMSSRLHSDLMGLVTNNFRPSQQSVQQLSTDLATILPTRTVPMMNTGELAQHLMVVMNGGGQNMFQVQNSIAGAQGILSMSGVPQQGIQRISSDLAMVSSL
jgi:hypothetical protein